MSKKTKCKGKYKNGKPCRNYSPCSNHPKRKTGRPKVDIDWNRVGQMLEANCSATGIAETIGVSREVLYRRCEGDNNVTFSTFSQQKKSKGDSLLNMKQFQVAMTGDKVMLIWLGKQRLGQSDKNEIDSTVNIATNVIMPRKDDEQ